LATAQLYSWPVTHLHTQMCACATREPPTSRFTSLRVQPFARSSFDVFTVQCDVPESLRRLATTPATTRRHERLQINTLQFARSQIVNGEVVQKCRLWHGSNEWQRCRCGCAQRSWLDDHDRCCMLVYCRFGPNDNWCTPCWCWRSGMFVQA
jgi:hypothetical protein